MRRGTTAVRIRRRIGGVVLIFFKPIGHMESVLSDGIKFRVAFTVFILPAVCVHLLKKKAENHKQIFIQM